MPKRSKPQPRRTAPLSPEQEAEQDKAIERLEGKVRENDQKVAAAEEALYLEAGAIFEGIKTTDHLDEDEQARLRIVGRRYVKGLGPTYVPTEEEVLKGVIEANRQRYDLLKHITTLASGTIVLLAAVADKVPAEMRTSRLLGWGIWLMVMSVVFSVQAMWTNSTVARHSLSSARLRIKDKGLEWFTEIMFIVSLLSFLTALVLLTLYAVQGFFPPPTP